MREPADLARSVGFVLLILAPSALLGAFPLWLGLRRRRPAASVAAILSCVGAAFVAIVAIGSIVFDLFAVIAFGTAAALIVAVAWSVLLLRWTS